MKSGDWRSHSQRVDLRVGHLFPEIIPLAGRAGSGNLGGASMRQTWGCRKILLKNLPMTGVLMVFVAPARLWDDFNVIRVGHDCWMGRWNFPHDKTLTLIFSISSITLIAC